MIGRIQNKGIGTFILLMVMCMFFLNTCGKYEKNESEAEIRTGDGFSEEKLSDTDSMEANIEANTEMQEEKGYDLPITDAEKEEAISDCKATMNQVVEIYNQAKTELTQEGIMSEQTIKQMMDQIGNQGEAVTETENDVSMQNYEKVDCFLEEAKQGKATESILYKISANGTIQYLRNHILNTPASKMPDYQYRMGSK